MMLRCERSPATRFAWALALLCAWSSPCSSGQAQSAKLIRLAVEPAEFAFNRPGDLLQFVVTGHYSDGSRRDLTRQATFSANGLVRVRKGVGHPIANGSGQIQVRAGSSQRRVAVTVKGQGGPKRISFQYDVLAVLARQSCSSGACHGSPHGKGGFRLSLRGFDPQLDKQTLVRGESGRRTDRLRPEQSLLLLKPLMKVAHGGGKRLRVHDSRYNVLRNWIAGGCRTADASVTCNRLEVYPQRRTWRWPDHQQQVRVQAHFSDGSTRDVTHLAVFSSSDEQVAQVGPDGLVEGKSRGTATVLVRYLESAATAQFTMLQAVPGFRWNEPPTGNLVDRFVFRRLRRLQVQPQPVCSDSEFIRRVYLDVVGILPTRSEVVRFLANSSQAKRDALIDRLLESREHPEFWAQRMADLLRIKSSTVSAAGVHKFHRWLVRAYRRNMPYNELARRLLSASGSTFVNPAASYYRTRTSVNDMAETTAQLFLGIRIGCARCHNHPFEEWTQDHYYGIGAFFSRVRHKPTSVRGERFVYVDRSGEVVHPRTGKPARPWLPTEERVAVRPGEDRRRVFLRWLTKPANPYFARVAVNRIWGHLLGRGLVEPVDDFRRSNPPSHPGLLDALAKEFIRSGYDQRHIIRIIVRSRTYQRGSATRGNARLSERYYGHLKARLLTAEQLLDALSHVTGSAERFRGLPAGTRATQLPGPDVGSDFLKLFGQPARNTACDCERVKTPKLTHALQLINGKIISAKLRDSNGRLARLLNLAVSGRMAAGSPPAAGLKLWLRADKGVIGSSGQAPLDGETVQSWRDQSGSQVVAGQTHSGFRPTFVERGIGRLPSLKFDGSDDFLNHTGANPVAAAAPRTMFVVARAHQRGKGGALVTFRRTRSGGKGIFSVSHIRLSGQYYVYTDGIHGSGNAALKASRFATIRKPFVTRFISGGTGTKLRVGVNGEPLKVFQPGSIGRDDGADGFTIGSREDIPGNSHRWHGEISEVLVYDRALDKQALAAVGSYLATKYNLNARYQKRRVMVARKVAGAASNKAIVTDLYLAAFCRYPTAAEMRVATDYIRKSADRQQGCEDLCWALLNSREFLFQH